MSVNDAPDPADTVGIGQTCPALRRYAYVANQWNDAASSRAVTRRRSNTTVGAVACLLARVGAADKRRQSGAHPNIDATQIRMRNTRRLSAQKIICICRNTEALSKRHMR